MGEHDRFGKERIWLQVWSINYLLVVPDSIIRTTYPTLKRQCYWSVVNNSRNGLGLKPGLTVY